MKLPALTLCLLAAIAPLTHAQNGFQHSSADGFWRFNFQPSLEMTYWHADTPLPGLLNYSGTDFFQPRLSLGLSVLNGDQWLLHVLARADRGFDPGSRSDGDIRVDEAFLRWRPLGDGRLNFQVGKFATHFGNWVPRHGFWDDPFLMPPLPYDNQLATNDRTARNPSPATIANRAGKRAWVPIIWGPSYSTGVSLFGSTGRWDYALDVKNADLSSRPDAWSPWEENGSHPSFTGRIGYRPDAAWAFGISASRGTYLRRDAERTLAAGEARGDFDHTVLGVDLRLSHHQFQVLGEVLASRSHSSVAGDLDALAYYLEGRWKLNSTVFIAARWAQGWNDDFSPAGPATVRGYTRKIWRATAAIGFRLTENLLVKTEYSYSGADAQENSFAIGVGFKF